MTDQMPDLGWPLYDLVDAPARRAAAMLDGDDEPAELCRHGECSLNRLRSELEGLAVPPCSYGTEPAVAVDTAPAPHAAAPSNGPALGSDALIQHLAGIVGATIDTGPLDAA